MKATDKQSANYRKFLGIRIYLKIFMVFCFLGLLLLLTSGSLQYWYAWIYMLTLFIPAVVVMGYFIRKDPDFMDSRLSKRREKEKEHKSIQNLLAIPLFLGLFIPGFDFRFHWSHIPLLVVLISDAFVLSGYLIIIRVMIENRFATSIIEISQEQKVIETGPYRIVRHPMYTGGMLLLVFTPLALGSYWALIPFAVCTLTALILRIINEEKLLIQNLPGYKEYCQKTRYRLIPLIW